MVGEPCTIDGCDFAVVATGMCASHYQKSYRAANPGVTRRQHLKWAYNLTPEDFESILEYQGNVCAICGSEEPGGKGSFHVDHDRKCCPTLHSCGRCVRGALCSSCNSRIMTVIDSPLLGAALAYALNPPAKQLSLEFVRDAAA